MYESFILWVLKLSSTVERSIDWGYLRTGC
jgi:hypothetical protein